MHKINIAHKKLKREKNRLPQDNSGEIESDCNRLVQYYVTKMKLLLIFPKTKTGYAISFLIKLRLGAQND